MEKIITLENGYKFTFYDIDNRGAIVDTNIDSEMGYPLKFIINENTSNLHKVLNTPAVTCTPLYRPNKRIQALAIMLYKQYIKMQ